MQDQQALTETRRAATIGLAALSRIAFTGGDLQPMFNRLLARVQADPLDAAALMDLSAILQMSGQREQGLSLQDQAIALRRLYDRPHGDGGGLRVLALMVAGDFMANTPLDFLFEGSDVHLQLLYIGKDGVGDQIIPEHDLMVLAIGEGEESRPLLNAIAPVLNNWPRPAFNAAAERIAGLTRDAVSALFAESPSVCAPPSLRVSRERLSALAGGEPVSNLLPGCGYPIIARPVGAHAGNGLAKLEDAMGLRAYLAGQAEPEFYVSPFVDYRSPDGLYRKQRIALIEGRPFAAHLAISEHWVVHYLSASMVENAGRREEEARFMAEFRTGFAQRHAAAFEELHRRIGLDYFVIDCSETADGKLLLFEADVAAIVHALDSEDMFPYKKPAMRELFDAFLAALERRASRNMIDHEQAAAMTAA